MRLPPPCNWTLFSASSDRSTPSLTELFTLTFTWISSPLIFIGRIESNCSNSVVSLNETNVTIFWFCCFTSNGESCMT